MYLKREDLVQVISGAGSGTRGKVMKVLNDTNQVVVQGVNLVFKHLKRSQKNPQGGRVQMEAPIHASKVQLVDPKTDKPTRVGFKIVNGRKIRFSKRSKEEI